MTECAFCGQDMYERVDVGVGVPAPVAVICCELAIDLDYAQRHEQDFVNVERSDLERVQSTLVELRSADEAQPLPPVEEGVPSGSGWLPIESAPKDGTEILGWRDDCGAVLIRWCAAADVMTDKEIDEDGDGTWEHEPDWFYADFIRGGRMSNDGNPTHWHPLPPVPGEAPSQSEREKKLEAGYTNLLTRYLSLANSGDCGFWNPEEEEAVIEARAHLSDTEGE